VNNERTDPDPSVFDAPHGDERATTDATPPNTTTDTADVWERAHRESARAHRAFLLWAMQDDDRRSVRAAGRAVGRAEATAREWRGRWSWNTRLEQAGELAAVKAATVYRARYYPEYKLREVVEVEDRMAAPFTPDTPIPASVADAVRDAVKPDTRTDALIERERRAKRAHVSLVDGALGLIAKRITSGDVRVSLRDIPHLLQLRANLTTAGDNNATNNGANLPPLESTRVRHARASNGDLVQAMHADAMELVAILGAIVSAGTAPTEVGLATAGAEA